MKAYKGFNSKLQCTPDEKVFQYEIGKEYEENDAKLCASGFHAVTNPIDVFSYYPPCDSRYCEVELDEVSGEVNEDSKVCGRKIKIGAEVGIKGIVDAFVQYTLEKVDLNIEEVSNTGYESVATNTGNRSAATNTGYESTATNTGYKSTATVNGKDSVAIVTGYDSKAKANIGSAIVVCERGNWNGVTYPLIGIKAAIIDGAILKANTYYKLVDGEFVECE